MSRRWQGTGAAVAAHVAGPDLVRAPDGSFLVLEDNMRAPSGLAYLLAARRRPRAARRRVRARTAVARSRGRRAGGRARVRGAGRRGAAPRSCSSTTAPTPGAAYEHADLAARIGMTVASVGDLERRGDRLLYAGEPVDVVYRRVDDERLTDSDGACDGARRAADGPAARRDARLRQLTGQRRRRRQGRPRLRRGDDPLLPRRGAAASFGAGVRPRRSGAARAGAAAARRARRSSRARSSAAAASRSARSRRAAELEAVAAEVRRSPAAWVAQEPVALSTHPTVTPAGIGERHVDLRPFVVTAGESVTVAAGGLTRFARGRGRDGRQQRAWRRSEGHVGSLSGSATGDGNAAQLPADRRDDLGGAQGRDGRADPGGRAAACTRWRSASPI